MDEAAYGPIFKELGVKLGPGLQFGGKSPTWVEATSRKLTVFRRFAATHSFSSLLLAPVARLSVRQAPEGITLCQLAP